MTDDRPAADLTRRDEPGIEIDRPPEFWKNVGAAVTSDRYAVPDGAEWTKDRLLDLIDEADARAMPMYGDGRRAVEMRADDTARIMVACYLHARHMDEIGQHDRAMKYREHADHLRRRLKSEGRKNLPDRVFDFDNFDAREQTDV